MLDKTENLIVNFPNTALRIQDYINDYRLTNFHKLPVSLKLQLYQSYVFDNRDDFMGELFCNMDDADVVDFFDSLKKPSKDSHTLFRAIIIKYLYKNYQRFFDDIFKYELEQRSLDYDMEARCKSRPRKALSN